MCFKDLFELSGARKLIGFLFLCTAGIVIYSYGYSIVNLEKSGDQWKLSVGSRYVITLSGSGNMNEEAVKRVFFSSSKDVNDKFNAEDDNVFHFLLWSDTYRNNKSKFMREDLHFPSYGKPRYTCPIKYSFCTGQEGRNYSAVFVHISEPTNLPLEHHAVPWILEYDQSPLVYKTLSDWNFMKLFTYSLGYRRDSDFFNPKVRSPKPLSRNISLDHMYDYAASVHSKCEPTRTSYLKKLSKYFRIWFFGDCMRNVERSNILRKGEENYKESKRNVTSMFKFTMAFMSQDCEDFVDEQLSDAWDAGSLPVFMGTESIKELIPSYLKSSYLSVSDFNNPEDLGNYLGHLAANKKVYQSYLSFNRDEPQDAKDNLLSSVWYPDYSLGCQIALKVKQMSLPNVRYLQPIKCQPRSLNQWLGLESEKIANDQ